MKTIKIPSPENLQTSFDTKLYNPILQKCALQISATSQKDSYTIFILPQFFIGEPLYDKMRCKKYISRALLRKGYGVSYAEPHFLKVEWDKNIIYKKNAKTVMDIIKNNPGVRIKIDYLED